MGAGAPKGNNNRVKGRAWTEALRRAIARMGSTMNDKGKTPMDAGMNHLADQLVELASQGDKWALEQLGDRIEGKPTQAITLEADIATHTDESVSETLEWVSGLIGTGPQDPDKKPRPH
ncbi:MAG: hypothetical protein K0U84_13555 [Actinomycetia bacterium]|nr:hypothetical protein [Actinomycetes bacterium]